jgi:anthranilate phosphoribosyltransferase
MTITNEFILEQLINRQDLDTAMVREWMERILSGAMPNAQIAASLALLRAKKESSVEIAAAADIVINKALPIKQPPYPYADIVGTGGDGHNTINVSTLASLTAASLGLAVAKHGNASVSSKCGSADVLQEVGINISLNAEEARRCLDQHQWCFLFAQNYHNAFKTVKSLRQELRIKTIFNVLGPLVNPLKPPIMLIGVYDPIFLMPFIEALKNLGRKRAMIVHGAGLDEIALHGKTTAALLDDQSIEKLFLLPTDLGLKSYGLDDIKGGDTKDNAKFFIELLSGNSDDAKTSLVSASSGVLLWLGEKAKTMSFGVKLAYEAIRAGQPLKTLELIRKFGHGAS